MATTKWFNLPGAKEAYIQDIKLRWVDDANLPVPWLNFYLRSATNWDFFTLAFPDQAWILKQLQFIDRNIDDGLAALEDLVPSSFRPQSRLEGHNDGNRGRDFVPSTVFTYYQSPAAMLHQQAAILHYARYLEYERNDERESEMIRMPCLEQWILLDPLHGACSGQPGRHDDYGSTLFRMRCRIWHRNRPP